MADVRWGRFSDEILRSQPAPDDLAKVWAMHVSGALDVWGVRLIEPDGIPPLLSHSYLTDEDRANVDIMCNIAAFDEMFDLSTFVLELDGGEVLGYWHGPERQSISVAPILQLDTEGQFELIPGACLAEAVLGCVARYAEASEFTQMRKQLSKFQIEISARGIDDIRPLIGAAQPGKVHREFYNRRRVAEGLPPV